MGEEMISKMLQIGFPLQKEILRLNWIGWDYIYKKDIRKEKQEMQDIFFEAFESLN